MFDNSRIFVSGATGSWGQTLITLLLNSYNVEEIVCFSRGELQQVLMQRKFNNSKLSRQQTIDYYQQKDGFNAIIMSPLAAGVGLNVVGANHVIHYTRHWNPAKEEQATDRAYRIGQTKDVYVYYPMAIFPETIDNSKNHKSFDIVLNNLLLKKKELAIGALYPSEQVEVKQNEIISELGF